MCQSDGSFFLYSRLSKSPPAINLHTEWPREKGFTHRRKCYPLQSMLVVKGMCGRSSLKQYASISLSNGTT